LNLFIGNNKSSPIEKFAGIEANWCGVKFAGIEANWCGVNARPQFGPFKI
jgi:hypothetical protein